MTKIGYSWLIFSFFYLVAPPAGSAQPVAARADSLFALWKLPRHPGGVVAWIEKGAIAWSGAYGMGSLEYEVPVTSETVFNTGSVSKQFTAFAIVLLAQEGKLSLEDDVRKYLPELPGFGAPITIRHLLTHTSGLRNFQNLLALAGWRDGDHMTNEDLLKYMAWQKELNFPTGSEYLYCNTGFNLCTKIVERVAGMPFTDFTKKRIFEPLGMTSTEFRYDLEKIYPKTATSYEGFTMSGFTRPKEYWTYYGNGNVYSTLADMAKWMGNFGNPRVGGSAAIRMLQERGILTNGDTLTYALGIVCETYRGLRVLQHGGSVGGYRAQLTYFPDFDAGVVVMTNFSSANPGAKALAIADLFLEGKFPLPKPATNAGANGASISPKPDPSLQNAAFLRTLEGVYYSDELQTGYTLAVRGDKLVAAHPRHADFELVPYSVNELQSRTSFFSEVEVVRDNQSHVLGVRVSNGRVRNLWFKKQ